MTEQTQPDDVRNKRIRVILSIVLVILFLLLIGLSYFVLRLLTPSGEPDSADVPEGLTWVRSIYGYGPSVQEQLLGPNDAGFGSGGTIWVTDGQRARILGFAPDGTYTSIISAGPEGEGPGQLYRPDAIDVSDAGEIYIADYGTQRVTVFSEDNEFLREWSVPSPLEVAVGEDRVVVGTLYGFGVYTLDGELITTIGTRGKADDEFDGVRGVVIDEDGTVYFADTHNKRIKAYDSNGELLWMYPTGTEGADEHTFQLPVGMTMDGNGRLVVLDAFDFQMVVLDPEQQGAFIAAYGEEGTDDAQFIYPTGIDYDASRDWFVVADTRNDRAQIVRIEGSGDNLGAALRRAWSSPIRLCALPLLLLLIAIAVARSRTNRSQKNEQNTAEDGLLGDQDDGTFIQST